MPLVKNRVLLACAGGGKTSQLVDEAVARAPARVLIVTYTVENAEQIRKYLEQRRGAVPAHIAVSTWFRWLLHDCVRPYQCSVVGGRRVRTILFSDNAPPQYVRRSDGAPFYLAGDALYRDRVTDFACHANELSGGRVVKRLEQLYDDVMIDEVQDLVGWDLELLDLLFSSKIAVWAVGDPRQAILQTSFGLKNKQFAGGGIVNWFQARGAKGILDLAHGTECHRSNQTICDLAGVLFPTYPKIESRNPTITGHDGIFLVKPSDLAAYCRLYGPKVLRYNKSADTHGMVAANIGTAKGRTYARTLIIPTSKMLAFLRTGDAKKAGDVEKLYVAVTRARHSVAFVVPAGFKAVLGEMWVDSGVQVQAAPAAVV